MINIQNVRYGFACNSSSSHSMIVVNKTFNDKQSGYSHFGWDNFVLSSKDAKEQYLVAQLNTAFNNLDFSSALVGVDVDTFELVDHQSAVTFPSEWDGKTINMEFFKEYKNLLLRNDVVVFGGNDNDDDDLYKTMALENGGIDVTPHKIMERGPNWVARKDDEYDYWVFFNRENGTKIRFKLGQPYDENQKITRSSVPELIDISITNYCSHGCSFCYKGSTTEGNHCKTSDILNLAYWLEQLQVFEVALGGGEPTEHPDFLTILTSFRDRNIIPNFTTKSTKWLTGQEGYAILNLIGSFAYSVSSPSELLSFIKIWNTIHRSFRKKVIIQVVDGVLTQKQFKEIYNICEKTDLPLTILGYKTTHRGGTFQLKTDTKVIETLNDVLKTKKYIGVCISVDTVFINQYEQQMIELGIPDYLYTKKEGAFSCYIDAVEAMIPTDRRPGIDNAFSCYIDAVKCKIGPSSFCDESEMVPIYINDLSSVKDIYKTFYK